MVYLYAIVGGDHPAPQDLNGVGPDETPVRLVPLDGLRAAVSDLQPDVELGDPDLLRHKDVVDELFQHGTVLPVRFGTALTDEATLQEELAPGTEVFAEQLDALDGKVEVEIVARYDEDSFLRRALAENEEIRQLSSASRGGTEPAVMLQLGEAVAEDLERRRAEDAPRLLEPLREVAVAASERSPEPEMVLRVSLLVEREAMAELDRRIESLEEETRGRMTWEIWGPLAPYAFAGPIGEE